MTTVLVDFAPELLEHGLRDLVRCGLRIVGSDRSDPNMIFPSVRLFIAGESIPSEFHGRVCRAIFHQTVSGLEFSLRASFEPVE